MRRFLGSAVLVAAMLTGAGGPASADPPARPDGPGWSVERGELVWRSAAPVPVGDAIIEFYAGHRLLGRPAPAPDQRTFTLDLGSVTSLDDLQVRAGGRRLDAAAPRTATRPPVLPPANPLPPGPVDPGLRGPHRTVTGEYSLSGVRLPELPAVVEMQGVVVAPRGVAGKRPLAVFLHGRHVTCFGVGAPEVAGTWPCPAGLRPIPSHRGYLQAQELLASQGYVTVSISANGINGQDRDLPDAGAQARSSLVRLHLAAWADWAGAGRARAPEAVRSAPRADLGRVFLMGHSRGGEGVSRAAMDSLTPPPAAQDGYHGDVRWTVRGMLLIGPTIFGHNPVPDVPSATILPGCDGDVADLQGQLFTDATRGVSKGKALHSSLYAIGANHNFFNTEWTPGQSAALSFDDFTSTGPDPVCSPGAPTRLTARQQQTAGATYIAAAARLFVAGDDKVRPLLDGTGVRAPSADPARVLSHAIGAHRTPALVPDESVRITGGRLCAQVTRDRERACLVAANWRTGSPHFVAFRLQIPEPGRHAVAFDWSAPGAPVTVRPAAPVGLPGARSLALRLVVPPNSTGNRFGVAVTGPDGRRTVLGEIRLDGLPGTDNNSAHWGQEVRVPLGGFRGAIAELELTPRSASGRAWLIDAWGWRPGTPAPAATSLPRIDVGGLTVVEGDAGSRTYQVPVRVTGRGAGLIRLFLLDTTTSVSTSWLATVRPGDAAIRVPIEVTGDTVFGRKEQRLLDAKAVRGTVVGDYTGGIDVDDDDPVPTLAVEPLADRVAEGGTLAWRFRLSATAESPFFVIGFPRPPATGTELSSTDVDPQWFRDYAAAEPEPSRPLSGTGLVPWTVINPGDLTADLTVPTRVDGEAEPDEVVDLILEVDGWDEPAVLGNVTGTVTD